MARLGCWPNGATGKLNTSMAVLKNPKHERFAQELAKGSTATDAYVSAGYKSDRGAASRLSANVSIQERVAQLLSKGAERAEVTIESLITEADDIQRKALAKEQFAPAVSALTAKAKLAGLWIEKSERTNRNVDPDSLSDAEIISRLAALRGAVVAVPAEAEEHPPLTH